jgi:DNA-binding response OmpR family regulator
LITPSTEVISMRIRRHPTSPFPALLLEPNLANAAQLASRLQAAGFEIRIEGSAESALQAQRQSFFFALIVSADLADKDCLVALDALRRRSPRSWMIVATFNCDDHARNVIHQHGGDTCISLPIDPDDLIARLDAFQLRARPSF